MKKGLFAALDRDEMRKLAAWNAAAPIFGTDDRQDCDGRRISWQEYGVRSARGWMIEHAVPLALGGADQSWNLRARHW